MFGKTKIKKLANDPRLNNQQAIDLASSLIAYRENMLKSNMKVGQLEEQIRQLKLENEKMVLLLKKIKEMIP